MARSYTYLMFMHTGAESSWRCRLGDSQVPVIFFFPLLSPCLENAVLTKVQVRRWIVILARYLHP